MDARRDHHATLFLPPAVAAPLEAVRRTWDPVMAAQIAAHVTVAYPREAASADLLVERARANAPFQAHALTPHVTLVHPRTSRRGRELWDSRSYRPSAAEFTARELAITAFDGARWVDVATFALGAGAARVERLTASPASCLGALLVESRAHGLDLVQRLVDEWVGGANRFARPGEALFVARIGEDTVGVCGLNVDPYAATPGIARVRHLYVLAAHRRRGIGRDLVTAVVNAARGRFDGLRLRTHDPGAARLYESLGFHPTLDVPDCTHVMEPRR